jgi:MinD-like ATPase involved in chromosome partitioning or flagellar assembly
MRAAVVGVVGGSGGVGASTFAAVLAAVAGDAVLVDLEPMGGGIDVLLGMENAPGARWSGLRLGGGRLDPALLADGLPRWGDVAVLAADAAPPSPSAVTELVAAAAELGVVVVDLPRGASPERCAALACCGLVVVLAAGDVAALAAARAVLTTLAGARTGALVRRGPIAAERAAGLAGAPLLGELPPLTARREGRLDPARLPRATARIAAGVLDGVRT